MLKTFDFIKSTGRSKWKGVYSFSKLSRLIVLSLRLKLNLNLNSHSKLSPSVLYRMIRPNLKTQIPLYSRASMVLPCNIGSIVRIYTGKKYVRTTLSSSSVGFKFGEFTLTTKMHKIHKDSKLKLRNKKK